MARTHWLLIAAAATATAPAARAGVTVDDSAACLDEVVLAEELAHSLPAAALRAIELSVRVRTEADRHHTTIRVERRGKELWSRDLDIATIDCPHLPSLVAWSVDRGLSAIPGLRWDDDPPRRRGPPLTTRAGVSLGGSVGIVPAAPRGHVELVTALGPGATWRWLTTVRGETGTFVPLADGSAQVGGFVAGSGLAADTTTGRVVWGSNLQLLGGLHVARGAGFDHDYEQVVPRLILTGGVDVWLPGPVFTAIDIEIPLVRTVLREELSGDTSAEPPVRLLLAVGLRWERRPAGEDE